MQETQVQSLSQEDPLVKGMATHYSVLAWKIPWTEKPGRLYSPWCHKELDMTEWLTLSLLLLTTPEITDHISVQFSHSVDSATSAVCQASLSIKSWSLLKLMSFESVMPFHHLIPCHPLLLLPSIFPNIRIFLPFIFNSWRVITLQYCSGFCHTVTWISHGFTGSFQMSQFFTSGGQSTGASDSASVLPMNIQNLFPLGWIGWISLQSKEL